MRLAKCLSITCSIILQSASMFKSEMRVFGYKMQAELIQIEKFIGIHLNDLNANILPVNTALYANEVVL